MSKKWLALALKFMVSGFLIWFLMTKIDLGEAKERLADVDLSLVAAAVGIILFQICIGGLRWGMTLKAIGAPLGMAVSIRLFYIGVFFSQVLPSSVGGDAVLMILAHKHVLTLQ